MIGLALLAGIGFTVSLFITELAFTDELLSDSAKVGIFIGSTVAGVAGYYFLRTGKTPAEELEAGRELMGIDGPSPAAAADEPAPTG